MEAQYDEGQIIAEIEKNATERIRIRLTEFKGYKLLDLRTFYQSSEGDFRPTGKGFSVRRDRIGDLLEALQQAEHAIGTDEEAAEPQPATK